MQRMQRMQHDVCQGGLAQGDASLSPVQAPKTASLLVSRKWPWTLRRRNEQHVMETMDGKKIASGRSPSPPTMRSYSDDMAVALARPAQRAEPVDGPLVEPDEIVAVAVAVRLIANAAKRRRGCMRRRKRHAPRPAPALPIPAPAGRWSR
jgi:hypothetical protein